MTDEDDLGPIPDPDAEPTPAERAHARSFADLVDKAMSGRVPAAMSTEDRALLEVATLIRGDVQLSPARQHTLVEDALRQAVGAVPEQVIPITRARRTWLPWTITGAMSAVAAAAIAVLALRTPHVTRPIPTAWKSRPSDALIGKISHERAGDASARLDYIFADRLDGYRDRRFGARP